MSSLFGLVSKEFKKYCKNEKGEKIKESKKWKQI